MFHFPAFPPAALCVQAEVPGLSSRWVSPFGHPRITGRLSPPRGFSQTPTSFIGSRCQGIHHVHLVACCCYKMLASTVKFSRYVRSRTGSDACSRLRTVRRDVRSERSSRSLIPQDPTVCQEAIASFARGSCPRSEDPQGVLTSIVSDRPTSRRPLVSCTAWNVRPRPVRWTRRHTGEPSAP